MRHEQALAAGQGSDAERDPDHGGPAPVGRNTARARTPTSMKMHRLSDMKSPLRQRTGKDRPGRRR